MGDPEGNSRLTQSATTSRCTSRTTRSNTSTSPGEIPEGEYGAGKVEIWDSGTYETHKFRESEVMVTFHGERLEGKFVLFQTKGKNWMIHRMDPPDPGHEPMPDRIVPMMAKLAKLPRDDSNWAYEIKWDGVRAICYCEGGRIVSTSRNLRDVTSQYLELRALGRALGSREAVLDGEIVAFDEDERPNFGLLQHRMHVGSETRRPAPDEIDPGRLHDLRRALSGRAVDDGVFRTRTDASCWKA